MSKYLDDRFSDDRFPDVENDRTLKEGPSLHGSSASAFTKSSERDYHIYQRRQWHADSASTWPLNAEKTASSFVASSRSRASNLDRPLVIKGQATGRKARLPQWLSRRATTRKSAVVGVLTIAVIISGLLVAIGPIHQHADAAPLAIYDGSLAPGWHITASHSTVAPTTMASPDGAGHPIAWTQGAHWSALYMRTDHPISLVGYSSLTLTIRPTQANQWFAIAGLKGNGQPGSATTPLVQLGGRPAANVWKQYTVPISKLAPRTTAINGIALFTWQGRSQHTQAIVYLDRIKLLVTPTSTPAKAGTATVPPTQAPPTPSAAAPPPTSAPTATPQPPSGSTFEGQGVYESCAPDKGATCLDRLNQIASGGFRLVVNYDQMYGTASQQLAYLDRAKAVGIKVIFGMSDPAFWNGTNLRSQYSELAATCGCSDNAGFTRYVINLVKGHSALWGYYVGDEVSPSNEAQVQAYSNLVHQADPSHPRLYVAIGGSDATANLSPFGSAADVLAADFYPVGENDGTIYTTPNGVAPVTQAVQTIATKNGKSSAMVLQSTSWGLYPGDWGCTNFPTTCNAFPTEAQMEQMRNLALQNGHLRMILWYSYFDVLRSDNPTQHWHDLVTAANAPFPSNALTR